MVSIMAKKIIGRMIILLLMIVICLGAFRMYKRSLNGITYYYSEGEETVLNPYIGYAPSSDSITLCERSTLVYLNIYWSELEPIEGE